MSPSLLALSYFIHLVATVVWIGGLVILTVLVIPEARRALADAGRAAGTPDQTFAGVYAAMNEYLSAKLRRPITGMTRPALTGALATAGVDRTDAQRAAALLDAAEHGRYSPAGLDYASPQALVDEATAVVDLLEKEFGR